MLKLLLAEDDELLATLLSYKLKKAGYDVDHVQDGKMVKEYLQHTLPDVIVSDIMMPYYSGIELVDYIRNELKSNIPIIILSTAGNEENVSKTFKLGANDFMSKPINASELLIRLEKELKKSSY